MTTQAWYNPYEFPINIGIQAHFEEIQREALYAYAMGLYAEHEQSDASNFAGPKIANGWKQFRILRAGELWSPLAMKYAPVTTRLLRSYPQVRAEPNGLAYFSFVPAGGIVRPHTYSHSRIRNQLALVVPEVTPEDEVYIQVGGEKRGWELGKTITFDDSVMHDVKNLSKHNRIVLLYDFKP